MIARSFRLFSTLALAALLFGEAGAPSWGDAGSPGLSGHLARADFHVELPAVVPGALSGVAPGTAPGPSPVSGDAVRAGPPPGSVVSPAAASELPCGPASRAEALGRRAHPSTAPPASS